MQKSSILSLAALASLGGCYVIPLDHQGRPSSVAYASSPSVPAQIASPPANLHLVARLYPANDLAAPTGMLTGQVTNSLNGRGTFTVAAGGENYVGEATRTGHDANIGTANATGSRGSYLRCRYTMNSPSQGSGECEFAGGAKYSLHLVGAQSLN